MKSEMMYLGSMLGTGSIVTIGIFLLAAISVAGFVIIRKKREAKNAVNPLQEEKI